MPGERLTASIDADASGMSSALKSVTTDVKGLDKALEQVGKEAATVAAPGLEGAAKAAEDFNTASKAAADGATDFARSQSSAASEARKAVVPFKSAADAIDRNTVAGSENTAMLGKLKSALNTTSGQMGPIGAAFNAVTNMIGPMGIAVAGVSAGLIALNAGASKFVESSKDLLSKTEEGTRAWNAAAIETETFSDALQKVIVGQGDVATIAARAQAANDAWKDTLAGLTAPFQAFGGLLTAITDDLFNVEDRAEKVRAKMAELADQTKATSDSDSLSSVIARAERVLADKEQAAQMRADDAAAQFDTERDRLRLQATRATADAIYEREQARIMSKFWGTGDVGQRNLAEALMRARQAANEAAGDQLSTEANLLRALGEEAANYQMLGEAAAAARAKAVEDTADRPSARGGAPHQAETKPFDIEEFRAAKEAERASQELSSAKQQAEADADAAAQRRADRQAQYLAKEQEDAAQASQQKMALLAAEQLARDKAFEVEATAKRNADAIAEQQAAEHASRMKEVSGTVQAFLGNSTRAFASALVAQKRTAKEQSEIARAAIADQVSAIGDMAVIKGIAAGADGNFAGAAIWAGVATAAYITASALKPGSGSKQVAAATPATAQNNTTTVQNLNYNVQINPALLDGESVSRAFAALDRATTSRGLLPARGMA